MYIYTEQLKQLKGLEQVAITTNGLVLTRQLPSLQRAGLDALNISLDTLREERFEIFTRRKGWARVMAAIDLAIQLNYRPVKVKKLINSKSLNKSCSICSYRDVLLQWLDQLCRNARA